MSIVPSVAGVGRSRTTISMTTRLIMPYQSGPRISAGNAESSSHPEMVSKRATIQPPETATV